MNSIVARQIWNRRQKVVIVHLPQTSPSNQSKVTIDAKSLERKQRQVRLFKIILLLMIIFFICRFPSWVYTIYKLNNTSDTNIEWILSYAFGILAMINCALNPYLYTFMSETIRLVTFLGNIIRGLCASCKIISQ